MRSPTKDTFPQRQSASMPNWESSAVVCANPTNDSIFVMSDGVLHRLDLQPDGEWAPGPEHDLQNKSAVVMSAAGKYVLVATEDHHV